MQYFKQLSAGLCLCFFFHACSIVEEETGEGSIEVFNETNGWVDVNINTTQYSLDVNESVIEIYELSYEVEHRLFGDDRIKSQEIISVDVNGEGLHVFPFNGTYDIEFDVITETYIEPDAGSLHLTNNLNIIGFSYDVIEIYISPSSSSDWGNNLLDENLHINETAVWRVDPDSWDIKIVGATLTKGFL